MRPDFSKERLNDSSTSLVSFISACQKSFDNVGLGTVLWQRRSSWFVSMNQRSLGDSWSSLPTEKNTDKMQIPDTESRIPLINCYLISFLSTSFRSAVVVCLITHAISASLKMLVNQCSQWRRWITLYSDGPVNVSQAFQGRGLPIKLCCEDAT